MAKPEKQKIVVQAQSTPNPHSMKFMLNQKVAEEYWEVDNQAQAGRSPLAQKIMGFPWVDKVFIGPDFISINKQDWVEWETLTDPLTDMIREHIESGQVVLQSPTAPHIGDNQLVEKAKLLGEGPGDEKSSEMIQKIQHILDTEIQPAVATDGGFIAFVGYKEGQVFLKMQGACSNCPSASMTLKQGIEAHLKKHFPVIKEVIAT